MWIRIVLVLKSGMRTIKNVQQLGVMNTISIILNGSNSTPLNIIRTIKKLYVLDNWRRNRMDKYLLNNGFTVSEVFYIEELITFFNTYLPCANSYYIDMYTSKVSGDKDDFGQQLLKISKKSRKHHEALTKAVIAYGKKLYAR